MVHLKFETTNDETRIDEVIFEFYLVSYNNVIESLDSTKTREDFEQTLTMDLDQLWLLALRVLQLFEDIITTSYPSDCGFFRIIIILF